MDPQNSDTPNQTQPQTPPDSPPKNKGGRPRNIVKLENGKYTKEDLFLFVPEDTLPQNEVNRWLQICDSWIMALDANNLSRIDLEEIALYARDRLWADRIYKSFNEAETTDTNLIAQVEKINKSLEQRKENLGSRFIDQGKKRKDTKGMSFLDLFEDFEQRSAELENEGKTKRKVIADNKAKNYTSTADYMAEHTANRLPEDKSED